MVRSCGMFMEPCETTCYIMMTKHPNEHYRVGDSNSPIGITIFNRYIYLVIITTLLCMPYISNPVLYRVFELLEDNNSKEAMEILLKQFNVSMDKNVKTMRKYRKSECMLYKSDNHD